MTWTVTKEEAEGLRYHDEGAKKLSPKLNVRAIIDLDNEQAELKELIASLQKHVKEG